MNFTNTIGMKLASLITMFVLVVGTPATSFFVYAEDGGAATSSGGDGGSGGSGGSGTSGGDAGSGASGGAASSSSSGDSSSSGGDGGAGGTGGGATDGGAAGAGGSGATGGDAGSTSDTGSADSSGGDGGAGGAGGGATDAGTGGTGGTGADGGTANSETDSGDATANGGAGGDGGTGGTADGGGNDGGAGGDAGAGGAADAEGSSADAGGGDGGSGGDGGGGGSTIHGPLDGGSTEIDTGNASSESIANTGGNSTSVNTASSTGTTDVELDDLFVASSTASSTATTGEVKAEDPDGILARLGNASALAILINIFNIAIKDSVGSILFLKNPVGSALDFTSQFTNIFGSLAGVNGDCSFMGCSSEEASFRFLGDSISEVNNEAISRAKSGGFEGSSEGGTIDVKTGNGDAMSVIWNLGHLTLANSRYLVILMANQGDLDGDVILPDGEFFKKLSSVAKISAGSTYIASSTVGVDNLADSNASSGSNSAIGDETSIDTGNANAHSSAGTMANMVGAPMCFIINIGGKWNGSVKRLPDTFTHERTSFGEIICGTGGGEDRANGERMEIERTNYAKIVNKAISEAITGDVHGEALRVALETGDASAFSHIMNLISSDIIGQDWIFANFAISGDWDGDLQFGPEPGETDILTEINNQISSGRSSNWNTPKYYGPNIKVTKTASVVAVASPAQVEYQIVVDNRGSEAHQVVVNDTMTGPDGAVIGKQMWNLGTVAEKEKVTIKYTIDFKDDAAAGYYTNSVVVSGQGDIAQGAGTLTAKDVIEILPAGEQPAGQCEPLLTEYIRPYRANTPAQVKVLQGFLNESEGENLTLSGVYDGKTQAAVKRFQLKHADEILTPWGITSATGNVYYTTQKAVNSINCKDDSKFQLTAAQQNEIKSFKTKLFSAPKTNIGDLLKMYDVGQSKGAPTAKGFFLLPPAAIPSIFAPVSNENAKPVSMMSLPTSLFKNWLLSAVPLVEAAER
ncbi:peptidoglycan-binding protein [bacterium]|nr:peptidoglycan-binding protein [bacterium]